ncbi:MAG: ThaI family type II restriction endonuclease [Melioribacteraceae bacterium]
MDKRIKKIFEDKNNVKRIQEKLPKLFYVAELESSRAGKIGMEVGSLRERILVALMLYKCGEENVISEIPITNSEVDVIVFGNPISIKTITGTNFSGVKLIWTVDADSALRFREKYHPSCDLLFVQINWSNGGGFYYIPKEVQIEVFNDIGKENYIKLPKAGTNPRGAEMSAIALRTLTNHEHSIKIPIEWKKEIIKFNSFDRWVELWQQD